MPEKTAAATRLPHDPELTNTVAATRARVDGHGVAPIRLATIAVAGTLDPAHEFRRRAAAAFRQ